MLRCCLGDRRTEPWVAVVHPQQHIHERMIAKVTSAFATRLLCCSYYIGCTADLPPAGDRPACMLPLQIERLVFTTPHRHHKGSNEQN